MATIKFTLVVAPPLIDTATGEPSIFNGIPYLIQDDIIFPQNAQEEERAKKLNGASYYGVITFQAVESELYKACSDIAEKISLNVAIPGQKVILEYVKHDKLVSEIIELKSTDSSEISRQIFIPLFITSYKTKPGDFIPGESYAAKLHEIALQHFALERLRDPDVQRLWTSASANALPKVQYVERMDGSIGMMGDVFIGYAHSIGAAITNQTRGEDTDEVHNYNVASPLLRYPNLDCPDKVILDQRFSLTIELLLDKPEGQPEPLYGVLNVEDTATHKLPEVEVVLSHTGFDLEGSNTLNMEVNRDDDSSVRFVLIPRKLGQQKIKVQFYQNGKPSGKAVRNILVSEQPVSSEVSQPEQPSEIELRTTLTIPPQDLELYIDLANDSRTLSFSLHSVKQEIDYHRTKLGQVILQGSPLEKMQSVYKEMTQLAQKIPATAEDRTWAEHRLEAVGNELWDELIPDPLKQEYWKFKSRVKSVLMTSEEPWIPWEMLKPYRENDDGVQENDLFWCQRFAISRWLSGAGTADELDIRTARSIAPSQVNLPSVKEEVDFMDQLSGLRASVTPLASFSSRMQVLDSLKNEDLSVLHFACHGMFDSTSPNDSAIKLSDGDLRPSDIRVRFGGRRQRPLIFINACHGGRAEFGFTGMGGWAERMVNARAGAFIGAMWEVSDKLALQFAKTFYIALLQENKTIAESFRQAREEIRQLAPYNSTWLAYTLYADPEGRLKA